MAMFNAFQNTNMTNWIQAGKALDISHDRLHLKSTFERSDGERVILNYSSIVDEYFDYIKKILVEVELTDEELNKYRFQPKRLCNDYYDTTELWSTLLRVNNMTSSVQFTKQKIKVFTEDIFTVLNEIMLLEEERLSQNRFDVYSQ